MARKRKSTQTKVKEPWCCEVPSRLTTGREIYPHRPDLYESHIWICDECKGYVGCHQATTQTMGVPADHETRVARTMVHAVLDPLWKEKGVKRVRAVWVAPKPNGRVTMRKENNTWLEPESSLGSYDLSKPVGKPNDHTPTPPVSQEQAPKLRETVYAYLAEHMGLTKPECHVGLFDKTKCQLALHVMAGVTRKKIKDWAKFTEDRGMFGHFTPDGSEVMGYGVVRVPHFWHPTFSQLHISWVPLKTAPPRWSWVAGTSLQGLFEYFPRSQKPELGIVVEVLSNSDGSRTWVRTCFLEDHEMWVVRQFLEQAWRKRNQVSPQLLTSPAPQ